MTSLSVSKIFPDVQRPGRAGCRWTRIDPPVNVVPSEPTVHQLLFRKKGPLCLILNLAGTDKVLSPGQLETLRECVDIEHTCGYITVANLEMYPSISAEASETGQTNNEESFGSSSTTKSGMSYCA